MPRSRCKDSVQVIPHPQTNSDTSDTCEEYRIPKESKRRAVYKIPCADYDTVYIGETGWSLNERIKEHKYAVNRGDRKNGVAPHAWGTQYAVDWSSSKVRSTEQFLWKRKVLKAIHIQCRPRTSNLDCRLQLNPVRLPLIKQSN